MTDRKSIWQMVRDVRDARDFDSRQFGPNMGATVAAALAAVGARGLVQGGAYPVETDYLAAQGATFPPVPVERLVAFNRETLHDDMTETDEMRRYALIADFFRMEAV